MYLKGNGTFNVLVGAQPVPSIECSLNKLEKRHTNYTVQLLVKQPLSEIFSENFKNLSNCNVRITDLLHYIWYCDFKAQDLLCHSPITFCLGHYRSPGLRLTSVKKPVLSPLSKIIVTNPCDSLHTELLLSPELTDTCSPLVKRQVPRMTSHQICTSPSKKKKRYFW